MKKSKRTALSSSCIICCKPSTTNTHRSEMLADNFPIIFLLRKLIPLPVSSSFCEDLLKENGHPSSWFSFCGSCLMVVMRSQIIYSQMAQLQAEFKSLQSAVKKRILKSFEGTPNSDEKGPNQVLGCREKVRRTIAKKCGLLINTNSEKEYGQRNFVKEASTSDQPGQVGVDESYFKIKSYGTLCTDSQGRISIKPPPERKKDSDEEMPPALIYYGRPQTSSSMTNGNASEESTNKRTLRTVRKRKTTKTTDMSYASDDEQDEKSVKKPRKGKPRGRWAKRKNVGNKATGITDKVNNTVGVLKVKGRPKKQILTERKLVPRPGRAETICPICHIKMTVLQLPSHIRNTHKEAGKTFKCDKCSRGFYTSFELRIHIRRAHTGEKPHKCPDCGKGYVDVMGLGRHLNKFGADADGIPKCKKVATEDASKD